MTDLNLDLAIALNRAIMSESPGLMFVECYHSSCLTWAEIRL